MLQHNDFFVHNSTSLVVLARTPQVLCCNSMGSIILCDTVHHADGLHKMCRIDNKSVCVPHRQCAGAQAGLQAVLPIGKHV